MYDGEARSTSSAVKNFRRVQAASDMGVIRRTVVLTLYKDNATQFVNRILSIPSMLHLCTFRNEDNTLLPTQAVAAFSMESKMRHFRGLTASRLRASSSVFFVTCLAVVLKKVGDKVGFAWVATDGRGASTNPRSSISVVELPRDQQIFAQDEEDENQAFADFAAG